MTRDAQTLGAFEPSVRLHHLGGRSVVASAAK
jgi:hypothetical protein